MDTHQETGSAFSLVPLFIFVGTFIGSSILFPMPISPIFSCLLALIFSLFTFSKKMSFNDRMAVFLSGSAQKTVLAMSYIFIFSAVFTYVLRFIGGIDAAVKIGMYFIPSQLILPGLFTVISFFATAIGSSMGAIAAFLPIGVGVAAQLGISPALMAGMVVGAAMLGDNLSIISDTTIAATQTTGTKMVDKFKANILLVIPAFFITIVILTIVNHGIATDIASPATPTCLDALTILPYAAVISIALMGIDVIAVLVIGILTAILIGIYLGHFSYIESTYLILEGFSKDTGIQEVLILALLVSSLS